MSLSNRPLFLPILKSNSIVSYCENYDVYVHKLIIYNSRVKSLNVYKKYPHVLKNREDVFEFKITLLPDKEDIIETFILIPLKIKHKEKQSELDYVI